MDHRDPEVQDAGDVLSHCCSLSDDAGSSAGLVPDPGADTISHTRTRALHPELNTCDLKTVPEPNEDLIRSLSSVQDLPLHGKAVCPQLHLPGEGVWSDLFKQTTSVQSSSESRFPPDSEDLHTPRSHRPEPGPCRPAARPSNQDPVDLRPDLHSSAPQVIMASPALLFLLLVSSSLLCPGDSSVGLGRPRSKRDVLSVLKDLAVPFLGVIDPHGALIAASVNLAAGLVLKALDTYTEDQLKAIQAELESLSYKMEDYHTDEKWEIWAQTFQKIEMDIELAWNEYQKLMEKYSAKEKKDTLLKLRDQFITEYETKKDATKKLHMHLTKEGVSFITKLDAAVEEHVRCHERYIRGYSQLINSLMSRGNIMNVLYYQTKHPGQEEERAQEAADMAYQVSSVLFQLHEKCLLKSEDYIKNDVKRLIENVGDKQQLTSKIWSFLDKNYGRYDWIVVAFKTKSSGHQFWKWRNKHTVEGFTKVERGEITVAVARQVKGTHSKAADVQAAIKRCIGSVPCQDIPQKLSDCEELKSRPYTAVHAFLRKDNPHQSTDGNEYGVHPRDGLPFFYSGVCKKYKLLDGKFVVMINSDEEQETDDPCSKVDCGPEQHGHCVPVKGLFIGLCKCHSNRYGEKCEGSVEDYKKKLLEAVKLLQGPDPSRRHVMASPALLFLLLVSSSLLRPVDPSVKASRARPKREVLSVLKDLAVPFLGVIDPQGALIAASVNLAAGLVLKALDTYTEDQLKAIQAELESLSYKMEDYHTDEKWEIWAQTFQKIEMDIELAWNEYQKLMEKYRAKEKKDTLLKLRDQFIKDYETKKDATKKLHMHLTKEEGVSFITKLDAAVEEHVRCHERYITGYSQLINSLMSRGNIMNVLYYQTKKLGQEQEKAQEAADMAYEVSSVLFQLHEKCLLKSEDYIKNDVKRLIENVGDKQQLTSQIWSTLDKDYPRYDWMVVAFKTKSSGHQFWKWRNKHTVEGFTKVERGEITVAVARQVKGTHSKAADVQAAMNRCIGSVPCQMSRNLKETQSMCEELESRSYTAVHAFLREDNPHQSFDGNEYGVQPVLKLVLSFIKANVPERRIS
ncbi:uncharacterized protein V6R79_021010 [Siganus canaliculatus]